MSDTEARARDAVAMLENPLFNEALDALEGEAMEAWIGTKADDERARERLWVMIKQARRLRGYFEGIRDEGRFAASKVVREPLP